jgi:hypothetical protein
MFRTTKPSQEMLQFPLPAGKRGTRFLQRDDDDAGQSAGRSPLADEERFSGRPTRMTWINRVAKKNGPSVTAQAVAIWSG